MSRCFDYNDVYPIWHASRGFQIAAQIIVGCMAFERLFVLNWPYVYLRVMTEHRTKVACIVVSIFGFFQFAVVRASICYAWSKPLNCGIGWAAYLVTVVIVVPTVSFMSFVKIYKIIRHKKDQHLTIRQYKGTVAAFLVLINTSVSQIMWLGLSVLYFTRTASGKEEDGFVATVTYLINCIVDPVIYVIWFRETRMELFKLIKVICPCLKPKIEKLRKDIYQISFTPGNDYEGRSKS